MCTLNPNGKVVLRLLKWIHDIFAEDRHAFINACVEPKRRWRLVDPLKERLYCHHMWFEGTLLHGLALK